MPSARAARSSSASSRVLPTPDSPATNASAGRPATASRQRRRGARRAPRPGRRTCVLVTREAIDNTSIDAARADGWGGGHTSIVHRSSAAVHRADGARLRSRTPYTTWANPLRLRRMEAPYGSWPSPIDGDVVARDPGWTHSLVHGGRRRRLLVGGAPAGGRAGRGRRAAPGRHARGRDPRRLQRPHPRARVRRRRLHRARRDRYFCTDADQRVYAHARRRARADHAGAGDRAGLRYADLQVVGRPARSACASAWPSPSTSTSSSRSRSTAASRSCSRRATTSTPPRASPPTARSSPGSPGTTRGCRGRAQSSTWRSFVKSDCRL